MRYYVEIVQAGSPRSSPLPVVAGQQPHWRQPRPLAWDYFSDAVLARTLPLRGLDMAAVLQLKRNDRDLFDRIRPQLRIPPYHGKGHREANIFGADR